MLLFYDRTQMRILKMKESRFLTDIHYSYIIWSWIPAQRSNRLKSKLGKFMLTISSDNLPIKIEFYFR